MSHPTMGLGGLPPANGGNYNNPRQAGMGYGGYYTGLDPREEAYAQQFGQQAQNGNFWRGAMLWGTGAVVAGVGTVAMERQWMKETSNSYTDAKKWYLDKHLTNDHKTALGITAGNDIDLKAVDGKFREGFVKNIHKWDDNPYKGVNKVLNNANDYAKVQLNAADPTALAKEVNLTNKTGWGKAGMVAGAVLAGGLLLSHLSASGEGNATTQLARERLAMLKAQEAMAQRGQA